MENKTDNVDKHEVEVVVRFNLLTAEYLLSGCDANPIAALGMLDYAISRIRGSLVRGELEREMRNRSLVFPPSGVRQ